MREYTDQNILKSIKCNKCGKNIKFDNTLPEEECYDNLTGTFEIPVSVMDNNELI